MPLGRGLKALISEKEEDIFPKKSTLPSNQLLEIEIFKIKPNPHQPRKNFDQKSLQELAESIKEHGIIQPLIVSPTEDNNYILIAGERRLKAAKMVGLKKVPVIIKTPAQDESLYLSLIENIQRKDLNPIERAKAYKRLIDQFNLTQKEISKKIGKHRATIANTLRLLELEEEIITALEDEKITEAHAKALLSLKDHGKRMELFKKIITFNLPVKEVEKEVRKINSKIKIKNPEIQLKEKELEQVLKTKVEIKGTKKRGKIIIHYFGEKELENIIKKLKI